MNSHLMDLAKNKLILLYILSRNPNLYNNHTLTNFILQNELMNYFFLNQYLAELMDSEFVEENIQGKLHLAPLGEEALSFFKNQITKSELDHLEKLLIKDQEKLQPIEYTGEILNEELILQATKGAKVLFEMKLTIEDNSSAEEILENFISHAEQILYKVDEVLTTTYEN